MIEWMCHWVWECMYNSDPHNKHSTQCACACKKSFSYICVPCKIWPDQTMRLMFKFTFDFAKDLFIKLVPSQSFAHYAAHVWSRCWRALAARVIAWKWFRFNRSMDVFNRLTYIFTIFAIFNRSLYIFKRNKLASLEATLVRNYDPATDWQGWGVELLA